MLVVRLLFKLSYAHAGALIAVAIMLLNASAGCGQDISGEYRQTYDDAKFDIRNESVDDSTLRDLGGGKYWTFYFTRANSRYIRFRFDRIHAPAGISFEFRIVTLPSEETVSVFSDAEFTRDETFITNLLPPGGLRIDLLANKAPAGLTFTLERVLWQAISTEAVPQSPVMEFKPVRSLPPGHPALGIAGSVALVHIGPTETTCTGVLIDSQTIATNYHCIQYSLSFQRSAASAQPACDDILAEFDYLDRNQRGISSKCLSLRTNQALDVALMTVDPAAIRLRSGESRDPIAIRPAAEGSPTVVSLLQHPLGLPLSLYEGCADVGIEQSDVLHSCLSVSGSSGSPLVDQQMRWVGLHYKGAYPDNWTLGQINNDYLQNGPRFNRAKLSTLVADYLGRKILDLRHRGD